MKYQIISCAISFLVGFLLCGCTGRVSTDNLKPSSLQIAAPGESVTNQDLSGATYAMEAAISDGCLKAWRTALSGNSKDALKQLDKLQQNYPKSTTISLMKGQVLEHAGDKKGAGQCYREGILDNEYSSIQRFKLAEMLSKSGDNAGAAKQYRILIKDAPQFIDARLGLAKTLLRVEHFSQEAITELKEVLQIDPQNKEALAVLKQANSR
jgi:tetratricopeptide (TPR) repeat protein